MHTTVLARVRGATLHVRRRMDDLDVHGDLIRSTLRCLKNTERISCRRRAPTGTRRIIGDATGSPSDVRVWGAAPWRTKVVRG